MNREELIRILRQLHKIEILAIFTDKMLYEQWLFDCEYGGINHMKKYETQTL